MGENPPGRHPEWLISADESLFSFCLNTLNRAPSDVYLHSLRANAAGRAQAAVATPGLEAPGLLCCGEGGEGRGSGVSRTQPTWRMQPPPPLHPQPGGRRNSTSLCSCTRWTGQVGVMGTVLLRAKALSPGDLQALKVAALCSGGGSTGAT